MAPEDYMAHDATGLAELVRRKEVTAVELADAAIERIDALNSRLNAVVERDFDAARAAAADVDLRAPLAGVPFLAKDMNIDVAGMRLTSSCRWLSGLPPAATDAPLAARWRSAGLTLLGRTNTPEFAGEFVTEPAFRGSTQNPWDFARSPGGSSGGAAAAVASGMVPMAHGTDSGGSIRVPAAACGLVGFKPSRGLVPVGPHHDELAGGLDCEHVLTRTVRDSALLLDLTSGSEPGSRYSLRRAPIAFVAAANLPVAPLKIGMALTAPGGGLPTEEIGAAVEQVADRLRRAGHGVGEFRFPESADIGEPAGLIWMTAIAEEVDFYRGRVGRDPRSHEMEALAWTSVRLGSRRTAVDYVRARRALMTASRDMARASTGFDMLLLPTTAEPALPTGQMRLATGAFDLARWNEQSYGYAPYTEIFNVTGQPAVSLPLAMTDGGLPIGVQFVAALGEDARLLALAAWFEQELPWAQRLDGLRSRLLRQGLG